MPTVSQTVLETEAEVEVDSAILEQWHQASELLNVVMRRVSDFEYQISEAYDVLRSERNAVQAQDLATYADRLLITLANNRLQMASNEKLLAKARSEYYKATELLAAELRLAASKTGPEELREYLLTQSTKFEAILPDRQESTSPLPLSPIRR